MEANLLNCHPPFRKSGYRPEHKSNNSTITKMFKMLEDLNFANLQMGQIYTMLEDCVLANLQIDSQNPDGYPFCEFTDVSGQCADG